MHRRKIGVIGGAGPLASALLYRLIIEKCYEKKIGDIPEIFIINFPFTRGLSIQESSLHHSLILREIQYCIDSLFHQGCDEFILSCNTLHLFMNEVNHRGMRFIHMPHLVLQGIKRYFIDRVAVLGTATT
jgi:aspartate racemase